MATSLNPPVGAPLEDRAVSNVVMFPFDALRDEMCRLMSVYAHPFGGVPRGNVLALKSSSLSHNYANEAVSGLKKLKAMREAGWKVSRADEDAPAVAAFMASYVAALAAHNVPEGRPLTQEEQAFHAMFDDLQDMMSSARVLQREKGMTEVEAIGCMLRNTEAMGPNL